MSEQIMGIEDMEEMALGLTEEQVKEIIESDDFKDGVRGSALYAGFFTGLVSLGVPLQTAGDAMLIALQSDLEVEKVVAMNELAPRPL